MSILKFSKEHNSDKNVGRVTFFILCTSSDNALYQYQALQTYLNGFQNFQRTRFPYKTIRRGIILSKLKEE